MQPSSQIKGRTLYHLHGNGDYLGFEKGTDYIWQCGHQESISLSPVLYIWAEKINFSPH